MENTIMINGMEINQSEFRGKVVNSGLVSFINVMPKNGQWLVRVSSTFDFSVNRNKVNSGKFFDNGDVQNSHFSTVDKLFEKIGDNADDMYIEALSIFEAEEEKLTTIINQFIADKKAEQQEKSFKSGWVWYQVKDKFGTKVANKFLPKNN